MVPFMYDDLKNLVQSIFRVHIIQSVIDNCSNDVACKNIDLLNKSDIVSKKKKQLTLGCATELSIAELVKKDIATSRNRSVQNRMSYLSDHHNTESI